MKIKSGYEIKSLEGVNIVVPTDSSMSFSGVITLNDTALFVWNLLQNDTVESEIVDKMAVEYDVPRDVLEADVKDLINSFRENGLLDE